MEPIGIDLYPQVSLNNGDFFKRIGSMYFLVMHFGMKRNLFVIILQLVLVFKIFPIPIVRTFHSQVIKITCFYITPTFFSIIMGLIHPNIYNSYTLQHNTRNLPEYKRSASS